VRIFFRKSNQCAILGSKSPRFNLADVKTVPQKLTYMSHSSGSYKVTEFAVYAWTDGRILWRHMAPAFFSLKGCY